MNPIASASRTADRRVTRTSSHAQGHGPHPHPHTRPRREALGVLVDGRELPSRAGVGVLGTVAHSPASRVGLAAGDTIVAVDGIAPHSGRSLAELVDRRTPTAVIEIAWRTPAGIPRTATVSLT